jgi:hypothetical protein
VGLILLKSCLNEGVGPAVYLTPDKSLPADVVADIVYVSARRNGTAGEELAAG